MSQRILTSRYGLWLVLALAFSQVARAQQTPPAIPPLKPPSAAHWVINYQQRENKSPTAPPQSTPSEGILGEEASGVGKKQIIKEEYKMAGGVCSVTKTYSNGMSEAVYIIGGVAYVSDATTKKVRAEILSVFSGSNVRFKDHYPGVDWVKKDHFVEVQEKDGKRFLHFKQGPTKMKGPSNDDQASSLIYDPSSTSQEREAWIDVDTGLPVSFRQGTLFGIYHHEDAPTEPVVLPTEFSKAMHHYKGDE